MENEKIIRIEHLQKKYHLYDKPIDRLKEAIHPKRKSYHQSFYALKDINLDIERGESVGIVGVNGSGKSTLLKLITGVLNPTSGTVATNGKVAALLELGAGFNPEYTGLENIYLNGTMMGYTEAQMESRVQPIVDFADIGDFIHQPVKTYSSGMFARLAFAVAINVEPEILIVDEALSVGDTRFQVKCINKMKQLKENGTTILFVSHATEQIKRFCNRAIWIKDGCVFRDGEASQVVDLYDNYMRFGDVVLDDESEKEHREYQEEQFEEDKKIEIQQNKKTNVTENRNEFENKEPQKDIPARILNVKINKKMLHTFESLTVRVKYEVVDEKIDDLLVGVALYSKDREQYIFGPNTSLDHIEIAGEKGRYIMEYEIPKLELISGEYVVDVGIFSNEGIVNFDYKMNAESFAVCNEYFSEGTFYMEHKWKLEKVSGGEK